MRIISQNGEVDLNYDNIYLLLVKKGHCHRLFCSDTLDGQEVIELGKFTTEESASKAMEKVRNAYARDNRICIIPEE